MITGGRHWNSSLGMEECDVVSETVNTNRSLQQTHASTQPTGPTPTPTPKPKRKTKSKLKKTLDHGYSKRRKSTASRSCDMVTKKPPTPTPTPTPTAKHKPKPKVKKKRGHGRSRSRTPTPPRGCEVETRYEFFRQSIPINSPRPATMKSIRLSESLGAPIFELLISMTNNGDFDHEIGQSRRCSNRECPYVTGNYRGQITLLMARLHEVLCNN